MKNELISMVELIDQYRGKFYTKSYNDLTIEMVQKLDLYENYANFLNTPLNISMFVPSIKVGDKWKVLENPNLNMNLKNPDFKHLEYQTAKDNVIFEGCYIDEWGTIITRWRVLYIEDLKDSTIQDLIKYKPTLTKKGLEVSGLNR
jgi:hypothetical protein